MDALVVLAQATSEAGPSEKTLSDEDWRSIFKIFAAIVGLTSLTFVVLMTLVLRYFRRWRWTWALLTAVLSAPVCVLPFFVIALSSTGGVLPALSAVVIPFAVAFLWPRRRVSPPANAAP